MNLDLAFLIIMALFFTYGLLRGILPQLASLIAVIAGVIASWAVPSGMKYLLGADNAPGFFLNIIIGAVVFIVCYLAVLSAGRNIARSRLISFSKGLEDRITGAVFSVIEGALIVLVLVWFFDCVGQDWLKKHQRAASIWRGSRIVDLARTHNPIAELKPVRQIEGMFMAAGDLEARARLESQPAYVSMVENGTYKALKDDKNFEDALRDMDIVRIFSNTRFRTLLMDSDFWEDFSRVDWGGAIGNEKTAEEIIAKRVETEGVAAETTAGAPEGKTIEVDTEVSAPRPIIKTPVIGADLRKIYLKNGSLVEGRISRRDNNAIMVEIEMDGGVVKMNIGNNEIERIE